MHLGRTAETRSYVIEVNPPFQDIVVLRATVTNQNPEDVKAGELTIELREDQAKELAVELLRYCWRGKAVDAEQMLELLSKAKRHPQQKTTRNG